MNYGSSSSSPGPSSRLDIQQVQKELHTLLQHLHWSYVALWTFDPQSRRLEWAGGHSREKSPVRREAEFWNDNLFNLLKACVFTPGRGSVGMAYADQRKIWMNGPSVYLSAGSKVRAQILKNSKIETAVYIPSAQTVLELGTSEYVPEDIALRTSVCIFMWEHILPALGQAQAPTHVSRSPLARESRGFLKQDFELNEQTRRGSSLDIDMFLQTPDEFATQGNTSGLPSEASRVSSAPTLTSLPALDLLQASKSSFPPAATNQALMRFQTYRSVSGTTSSSLSSLKDSPAKLSADSPEQSISPLAFSSHRHHSHNYASSSARRPTPTHSPEFHPVDTTVVSNEPPPPQQGDIQQSIRQMLGEELQYQPWPQIHMDPGLGTGSSPESAFNKAWPLPNPLPGRDRSAWPLRQSLEFLSRLPNLQQRNQALQEQNVENRLTSSSSPEDLTEQFLVEQAGPSLETRRSSRGGVRSGTPGSRQEDAAKAYHMLSERRRRKKQTENFAALRKLVPVISKNDKASILGDAILYLKELHVQIQELQADKAVMQSRYEALTSSNQDLQERNNLLEALVGQRATSVHLPPPP